MIVPMGSVVGWIVILTAFLLLNEVITRRWSLPGEVARKVAHLGSALLVMISCLQLPFRSYLVIGPIFAVALLVARSRLSLRSLSVRADTSWGEVLFGIGVAAAAGAAPDRGVFLASVGVLGLADTASDVVGRRWPIRPLVLGRSLGGLMALRGSRRWCASPSQWSPSSLRAWRADSSSWSAPGAGTT